MKYQDLIIVTILIFTVACGKTTDNASTTTAQGSHVSVASGEAPYLFTDSKGHVYLTWTESTEETNQLKYATLQQNNSWSTPKVIAEGKDWFVNWADYPVIATKDGANFMSHYLSKSSEGTYSYDVTIKQSTDGANNWTEPYILHNDGKAAEHGFVTIVPFENNFFVTWLDGRNTVSEENNEHGGHGAGGPMTIRAAVISPSGEKIDEWELDNKVCDCCQTTAVITDNGPLVAYRDRSDEEIRDMSVTRLVDDEWTAPESLHEDNWKIAGCPVNGPRMSALANSVVACWFSAAEGKAEVKIIFSHDGGTTFGPAVKVSKNSPIGRVDVEMLTETTAIISWMEGSDIVAAKVNDAGEILEEYTIASSSESRSSGFPQMTKANGQLIFAWTDAEDKIIKTTTLKL